MLVHVAKTKTAMTLMVAKQQQEQTLTGILLWSEISNQPLAQRNARKHSLGRNRFEIGICPFSREAGSIPFMDLCSIFFANVFPVNRKHVYHHFGDGSNT